MALVGRRALLEYNVGGAQVIHERWVVAHVQDEDYVVVTPDEDVYTETLSVLNPDVRSFRLRDARGRLPAGVPAGVVYALPAWGAGDRTRLEALGQAEAVAEKARRGVPGGQPVVAPVVPVPAQAGGVTSEATGEDVPPGASGLPSGTAVWVAAETAGGYKFGAVVSGVVAAAVGGAKTIHSSNGVDVFCQCIDSSGIEAFNAKPCESDIRIVKIKMNAVGTPERPLADIVAETKEYKVAWKISGPRTARWCLNYLVIEGFGFEAHHERFRQLCKLEVTTWGVMEHFQLSMILRQLIQVDMLNGYNNLGIELMFRRLQTIEYAHSEKAREMESKAVGGKLSLEEQMTFGSLVRQAGTLMIAPTLLEHVKLEVEKDVQLQKNIRKAREERELARKAKPGKEQNP